MATKGKSKTKSTKPKSTSTKSRGKGKGSKPKSQTKVTVTAKTNPADTKPKPKKHRPAKKNPIGGLASMILFGFAGFMAGILAGNLAKDTSQNLKFVKTPIGEQGAGVVGAGAAFFAAWRFLGTGSEQKKAFVIGAGAALGYQAAQMIIPGVLGQTPRGRAMAEITRVSRAEQAKVDQALDRIAAGAGLALIEDRAGAIPLIGDRRSAASGLFIDQAGQLNEEEVATMLAAEIERQAAAASGVGAYDPHALGIVIDDARGIMVKDDSGIIALDAAKGIDSESYHDYTGDDYQY